MIFMQLFILEQLVSSIIVSYLLCFQCLLSDHEIGLHFKIDNLNQKLIVPNDYQKFWVHF